MIKPLFVPLYKEYFLKFKSGEQDCEIRPEGHRGWTREAVVPGRRITFSNGYGKYDRTTRDIVRVEITPDLQSISIPKWHITAVEEIYGKRDSWLVAYVGAEECAEISISEYQRRYFGGQP